MIQNQMLREHQNLLRLMSIECIYDLCKGVHDSAFIEGVATFVIINGDILVGPDQGPTTAKYLHIKRLTRERYDVYLSKVKSAKDWWDLSETTTDSLVNLHLFMEELFNHA